MAFLFFGIAQGLGIDSVTAIPPAFPASFGATSVEASWLSAAYLAASATASLVLPRIRFQFGLPGRIQRFPPAAGSGFSVLRADDATGNLIEIAPRIPVRIELDPGRTLLEAPSPGMSVVVSIDTSVGR